MKITIAIPTLSTYALVNPALVFRQGEVHTVSDDLGAQLLNLDDADSGDAIFEQVEEEDTATDVGGTTRVIAPAKKVTIGRKVSQVETAAKADDAGAEADKVTV